MASSKVLRNIFGSIYRPVHQDDNIFEKGENHEPLQPRSPYARRLLIASHIILFGFYVLGLLVASRRQPSTEKCNSKLSTYSPALPVVTYQEPRHLNAEIIQENPYRGPPSPEIDAAWLRIGLATPGIRLFEFDLKLLNKTDTSSRRLHRIPEEFGGGYLGMLEVFHLLHCLNSLRKATYKEYYIKEWEKAGERAMRVHNDHCIDMLREVLMCSADVTPLTFYDALDNPARKLPMPDFSTLHTCRNFDEILEWNANNDRAMKWDEMGLDLSDSHHVD